MTAPEIARELVAVAARLQLDPQLLAAQVWVESGANPYAWNPEPRYRWFWNVRTQAPFRPVSAIEVAAKFPPGDFLAVRGDPDQEWWAQQASWGLLQVMGAVAREDGFIGPYLTALCDPVVNLAAGARHLAQLVRWAKGDIDQALAAYNGGKDGNAHRPFRQQGYVDKVRQAAAKGSPWM